MRPFTGSGALRVRHNPPRTVLIGTLVAAWLIATTQGVAAAPPTSDQAMAAAGGTRILTSSGRSSAGGRIDVQALRESASPSGAPDPALAMPGAYPIIARQPVGSQGLRSPRIPTAPPGATATIPTTMTLEVTPANPIIYPGSIHLTSTITPVPIASGGFIPAVAFYIDGNLNRVDTIADDGTSQADMQPAPGTHSIVAQFGGIGDYEASSSAPVSVTVVQKPDLATEQGSAALQSSQGFEVERHTPLVAATSPSIGVGPSDIITMNEREATFLDRSGTRLFHLSVPDFFFFEPAAGQANDTPRGPQIVFDKLHNRWIATQVTHDAFFGKGHVYIWFTTSSNALTADWWTYRFDFNNEAPRNPEIGISSNKIAIGYDVATIDTSTDLGSTMLVVDTAQLFAHPSIVNYQRTAFDPTLHGWRPAVNRSAGPDLWAVGWTSAVDPARPMAIVMSGNVGGLSTSMFDLSGMAPNLPDLGQGAVRGPTDALWANNHLWFVSTRSCLPVGDVFEESCVRVTELDTSAGMTVLQDFVIARNGYSNFLGGIAIAGDGSVVITYSQASSGPSPEPNPISTWATVQAPGDPANAVRPSQLLAAGEQICSGPECNAGSWNLTQLPVAADPNNSHAVWQASLISVAGGWATEATRLSRSSTAPAGTFVIAGGRSATNALRLGITPAPGATATATQVLISNSPTTAAGVLSTGKASPIDGRVAWSLADAAFGGSGATGARTGLPAVGRWPRQLVGRRAPRHHDQQSSRCRFRPAEPDAVAGHARG